MIYFVCRPEEKVIFLAPVQDRQLMFSVKIAMPLVQLLYTLFCSSVCRSGYQRYQLLLFALGFYKFSPFFFVMTTDNLLYNSLGLFFYHFLCFYNYGCCHPCFHLKLKIPCINGRRLMCIP